MLAKLAWSAWLPRILPAMVVLLAYFVVIARSNRDNVEKATVTWTKKQASNQTLEVRKSELVADLERMQQQLVANARSYEVNAKTELVANVLVTSSASFASLLEIFERHRLSCQRTENIDHSSAGKSSDVSYRFELSGSFVDVKGALQDIGVELPHVAPAKLHLRRESNGVCRWEIAFQMEKELL